MRVVGWLALLLVLAGGLAGCSTPPAPPVGLPVDDDGRVLPTVEGFVVDDAIRPMQGAVVRVLSEGIATETDADGHYAILRPTDAAQTLLVSASAPGYRPLAKQMQASRYTSERLDFRLEPDPAQVPHTEVFEVHGALNCQVRAPLVWVACAPPTFEPIEGQGLRLAPREMTWVIETSISLAGAVLEVAWEAENPATEHLQAVAWAPVAGGKRETGRELVNVTGASPLRLEIDEATAQAMPSWTSIWLEITLPEPDQGAGLAVQQRIDAFATLFYVDPAPPGYRLG